MTEAGRVSEDPPPQPPREPEPGECCQSGCEPCVYDIYWDAYARYEAALLAWQTRQRELK
ncbi:MAG TPA: oxidoreductase-like domain-containing protein [Burkholderiales bacterium]|nr:oxidoreductase-like domain-containing protein [Burkholderiales bacterium]